MPQFHEGQDVEVRCFIAGSMIPVREEWRKAKVVECHGAGPASPNGVYSVLFPDGTRDAFGAAHIRAVEYAEPPAQWYDE
jgi:hypothetical protein